MQFTLILACNPRPFTPLLLLPAVPDPVPAPPPLLLLPPPSPADISTVGLFLIALDCSYFGRGGVTYYNQEFPTVCEYNTTNKVIVIISNKVIK